MTTLSTEDRKPLSQALRRLRRDWAFTAAFVITLALGIAANVAVFSALDAYVWHPLSYPHSSHFFDPQAQLYQVSVHNAGAYLAPPIALGCVVAVASWLAVRQQ
ncbi:membrane protein, partial [mine drainage metagenome]